MSRADRIRTTEAIRPVVFDAHNLRVKIYGVEEPREVLESSLLTDAARQAITKAIVYARGEQFPSWKLNGFVHEGVIRGYFADGAHAQIWSRFIDPGRARSDQHAEHERIVEIARGCEPKAASIPEDYRCEAGTTEDAAAIAALMQGTFSEYPDPISPEWVRESILDGSRHFRIVRDADGTVVASASAEIDHRHRSAELTDCATDPSVRGRGLMRVVLSSLEQDMLRDGIDDLYTLARADELPMNCAFAKLGWSYTGRLVNNCRMPNGWESMNIWCRGSA